MVSRLDPSAAADVRFLNHDRRVIGLPMAEHSFVGQESELAQLWEVLGNALGGGGRSHSPSMTPCPACLRCALAGLGRLDEAKTRLRAGADPSVEAGTAATQRRVRAALGGLCRTCGDVMAASVELAAARSIADQLASSVLDEPLRRSLVRKARGRM